MPLSIYYKHRYYKLHMPRIRARMVVLDPLIFVLLQNIYNKLSMFVSLKIII